MKAEDVLVQALALTPRERAHLATDLLESLSAGVRAELAPKTVGVMGSGLEPHRNLAGPLGVLLANLEVNLLTGGGSGVMEAVAEAFLDARPRRGISIGILPAHEQDAKRPPPGYPNAYVQLAVVTHLPDRGRRGHLASSRNHLNVLNSDALVALPGSHGTLSEVQLALEYRKPVLTYCPDASLVRHFPADVARAETLDEVKAFLRDALRLDDGEPNGRAG